MSLFKQIILGVFLLLTVSTIVLFSSWRSEKLKAERWQNNYEQEKLNHTSLKITVKELKDYQDSIINSLKDSLELRPKEIVRYKTIVNRYVDTVRVIKKVPYKIPTLPAIDVSKIYPEKTFIASYGEYPFVFDKECYTLMGNVVLEDDLYITMDTVRFASKYTDIVYKKRKHKFLWFHFGKWEYYRDVVGNCGEFYSKEVEVIKE